MTIVFGIKHIIIESFSKSELKLEDEKSLEGAIFEYRQAYFHLFFIPFFGLGKDWVLYKRGEYFKVPKELRNKLPKSNTLRRFIWQKYIGIYLMILSYFSYLCLDSYSNYRQRTINEEIVLERINTIKKHIEKPLIGDQYQLKIGSKDNWNDLFVEVHQFNSDSIQFTIPLSESKTKKSIHENSSLKENEIIEMIEREVELKKIMKDSVEKYHPLTEPILEELLFDCRINNIPHSEAFVFIWISKKSLKNCLPKYTIQNMYYNGNKIKELTNFYNSNVKIENIINP